MFERQVEKKTQEWLSMTHDEFRSRSRLQVLACVFNQSFANSVGIHKEQWTKRPYKRLLEGTAKRGCRKKDEPVPSDTDDDEESIANPAALESQSGGSKAGSRSGSIVGSQGVSDPGLNTSWASTRSTPPGKGLSQ